MEAQIASDGQVNPLSSSASVQTKVGVDPIMLRDWIKGGEVFLVDLRSPDEFEQSRIAGSFLLPRSRVNSGSFPKVSGLKTVFVCPAGAIAQDVANDFASDGSNEVFALEGGLSAWQSAGYELDN